MRAFVVLAVALASCTSARSGAQALPASAAGEPKGTVILSTTRAGGTVDGWLDFKCDDGTRGTIADNRPAVRVTRGRTRSYPMLVGVKDDPWTALRVDPANAQGQLHVLELRSGRCEFFSYSAVAYGVPAGSPFLLHTVIRSTSAQFSILFDVPANGTAYIGSFRVGSRAGRSEISYEDEYERDLSMLKAQDRAVPARPEKRIARVVHW